MAHRRSLPVSVLAFCAATLATTAPAQTLLSGNHSIDGRLCVGVDCTGSETFPESESLKIKSELPRLRFEDTSTSNSTDADWLLQANPVLLGQNNFFGIENLDGAGFLFVLEGAAPENALFVDGTGNIGFGTALPLDDLHIIEPMAPGVRLTRDTSGGATALDFTLRLDSTGLGTGFQIEDESTGNVPFQINSGADGSLVIGSGFVGVNLLDADNDFVVYGDELSHVLYVNAGTDQVGMGTNTPTAPLHVTRSDGTGRLLVEETNITTAPRQLLHLLNNGQTYFTLEDSSITAGPNSGRAWNFQNLGGTFRVTTAPGGAGEVEMVLDVDGNMTIEGNYFASSGTQLNVPDYVFADDYDLKPLSEVQAFIDTHSHLPDVPSAADINAQGLNMTDMQMRLLKKVEELTLYTLDQQGTIDGQKRRLDAQEDRLARMDALEAANGDLRADVAALQAAVKALAARD